VEIWGVGTHALHVSLVARGAGVWSLVATFEPSAYQLLTRAYFLLKKINPYLTRSISIIILFWYACLYVCKSKKNEKKEKRKKKREKKQ